MSIIITPELVKKYLSFESEYMPKVGECDKCPFLNYCGAGEYCWKEKPVLVTHNERAEKEYEIGGEPQKQLYTNDERMSEIKKAKKKQSPRHEYQRAYYLKKTAQKRERELPKQ